jgi:hypothetical protein
MPSHRATEISYYEELGLEQNASPAEIRDSFRALVRLLHPDQHIDPELKAIADRQLQKINRIYSVLSDPEKRRSYDAFCNEKYVANPIVFHPPSSRDPRRFVSRFLWIGALAILAGTCLWLYLDDSDSAAVPVTDRVPGSNRPSATPGPGSQVDSRQIKELRSELQSARLERDAARLEVARLRATLDHGNTSGPTVAPTIIPPPRHCHVHLHLRFSPHRCVPLHPNLLGLIPINSQASGSLPRPRRKPTGTSTHHSLLRQFFPNITVWFTALTVLVIGLLTVRFRRT